MSQHSRRRLRLQFGLKALLALTALAAGAAMAWRVHIEPYRRQRETMALIEALGGSYKTTTATTWLRLVFGKDFQNITFVDLADCDEPEAYLGHMTSLPALEILVVGGHQFQNHHVFHLSGSPTLRWLVLDSTEVNDEALIAFQTAAPAVKVHCSERRAIGVLRPVLEEVDLILEKDTPDDELAAFLSSEHFEHVVSLDAGTERGWTHWNPPPPGGRLSLQIDDTHMRWIGTMRHLTHLGIAYTRATDAGLAALPRLPTLVSLSLRRTAITNAGLAQLRALTQLEELSLASTKVDDAGLEHLAASTQLQWLKLARTAVGDRGLRHLRAMARLRHLNVAGTRISDAGLEHQGIETFEHVDLDSTEVTDEGLVYLAKSRHLEHLFLNGTRITDRGLAQVGEMTNLTCLCIRDTDVSDRGINNLARLPRLRALYLERTRVTPAGVRGLQQALPKCTIHDR